MEITTMDITTMEIPTMEITTMEITTIEIITKYTLVINIARLFHIFGRIIKKTNRNLKKL